MQLGVPKFLDTLRRGVRGLTGGRTATSTARVATERPERYGKQLVSHMSRRHGGEWSAESASGWMQLGSGRATVRAEEATLVIDVTGSDPGQLAGLEDVVGRHLAKFGAKEGLVVDWRRSDGTRGSHQP
ncbi:MAG: DUF2218 domain-containing protein [Dermatophilus congolensis]|nr:DUF2218 domain-containing protein [Dermatophilus congolensis]